VETDSWIVCTLQSVASAITLAARQRIRLVDNGAVLFRFPSLIAVYLRQLEGSASWKSVRRTRATIRNSDWSSVIWRSACAQSFFADILAITRSVKIPTTIIYVTVPIIRLRCEPKHYYIVLYCRAIFFIEEHSLFQKLLTFMKIFILHNFK